MSFNTANLRALAQGVHETSQGRPYALANAARIAADELDSLNDLFAQMARDQTALDDEIESLRATLQRVTEIHRKWGQTTDQNFEQYRTWLRTWHEIGTALTPFATGQLGYRTVSKREPVMPDAEPEDDAEHLTWASEGGSLPNEEDDGTDDLRSLCV
jgi:hypothetical protein